MSIDSDLVKLLADSLSDDPDAIDETVFKNMAKRAPKSAPAPRTPNIGMLSESNDDAYTHKCRNKVYRRGIVMACGKACYSVHCEGCKPSRAATSQKMLGETSKKKPSNTPDMLNVEKDFDTHDEKRKSSLSDLEGEEGSGSKPYPKGSSLKESDEMEFDYGKRKEGSELDEILGKNPWGTDGERPPRDWGDKPREKGVDWPKASWDKSLAAGSGPKPEPGPQSPRDLLRKAAKAHLVAKGHEVTRASIIHAMHLLQAGLPNAADKDDEDGSWPETWEG